MLPELKMSTRTGLSHPWENPTFQTQSKANDFPIHTFLVWYAWLSVIITLLNVVFTHPMKAKHVGIFVVFLLHDLRRMKIRSRSDSWNSWAALIGVAEIPKGPLQRQERCTGPFCLSQCVQSCLFYQLLNSSLPNPFFPGDWFCCFL